ncbi:MAG: mechanosensitive ion channel family protein [Pseudomonadota bacterium]
MSLAIRFLCLFLLISAAFAGVAEAQGINFGTLFSSEPEPEPQQSRPLGPLPDTSGQTLQIPSASDYGALTVDSDPMLGAAKNAVQVFRTRLIAALSQIPNIASEVSTTLQVAASPRGQPTYFIGIALFSMLLLAVGRGVTRLYAAYVARPLFVAMQRPNPQGYLEKLPVLAYRILLTVLGIALTIGVASAIGLYFYQEHEPTLFTVITIFATYGAVMLVDTIWRMALSPFLPRYRLAVLDDRSARNLYRWLVFVSGFGIICLAFNAWMEALGLVREVHILLDIGANLAIVIALLVMVRLNYREICELILSGRSRDRVSWVTLAAMRLWAPLSALYLIAAWGKLTFDLIMGIESGGAELVVPYLVLLIGLVAYAVTSYLIERIFTRARRIDAMNARAATERAEADDLAQTELQSEEQFGAAADIDGDGDEEGGMPVLEETRQTYVRGYSMRTFEDLARRVASLFAIGAGAWALLYYWGGIELFAENALFGIAEDLIDILFIGYIAYHAVRIWIDQKIEEEGGDDIASGPLDGEGGGTGATRLATLLPLIRNFVLAVILIALGLVTASEMGVNVAPLFAGAGIVGLAIGFGSQALVRDILSGAFFLLDDAFRKGEYIDVGDVKGTVEKISLRSFQLRHHLGMLHTIPFGEIQFLTNFSRDWVMMKLPLRVTYDTDVERVRKLIKKLGIALLDDPVIGDNFIQPLKSQGVIHMDDSAMIIRVKFMTKPGDQWVVRKRVYQEIRDLFDREGVKFAHREVTVRIPDLPTDRPPTDAEVKAIGAAARRIGDDSAAELLATGTGGPADDR